MVCVLVLNGGGILPHQPLHFYQDLLFKTRGKSDQKGKWIIGEGDQWLSFKISTKKQFCILVGGHLLYRYRLIDSPWRPIVIIIIILRHNILYSFWLLMIAGVNVKGQKDCFLVILRLSFVYVFDTSPTQAGDRITQSYANS